MKHIFCAKNVKPRLKTESSNKADAQTSGRFIKKKTRQPRGDGGWGYYQSNDRECAGKSKATSWAFPLPPVDGWHPETQGTMSCSVVIAALALGALGFQVQGSRILAVGSWTSCEFSEPQFPPL